MDYPDLGQKNPAVNRALDDPGVSLQIENYTGSFVYHELQMTLAHCSSFDSILQLYSPRRSLFIGLIYLFSPVSHFDVVNLSIWSATFPWWIIKCLMNKIFVMNGVHWDQTYGEERPLPTPPLFLSLKKKEKNTNVCEEKPCLSGQHFLDEPEIKAFKAKEVFQSLNQHLGNYLKTSALFFEANNGTGREPQVG